MIIINVPPPAGPQRGGLRRGGDSDGEDAEGGQRVWHRGRRGVRAAAGGRRRGCLPLQGRSEELGGPKDLEKVTVASFLRFPSQIISLILFLTLWLLVPLL